MAESPFKIDEEEMADALIFTLRANGFKSYDVTIDSEYAKAVEFGGYPRTAGHWIPYKAWERWAMYKPDFFLLSPRERNSKIYFSYKKANENGTAPHPFIRPALDDFENGYLDNDSFFKDGTMKDLAERLADHMKSILDDNGSVVTGALKDHIKVQESRDYDEP